MLAGLSSPFRKRHPLLEQHDAEIRAARQDFPADPEYLRDLDLGKILNSANAERQLDEVDRKLRALQGTNLTKEAQHSLLVHLVTAQTLAGLFQGKTEEQIAQNLRAAFADGLKSARVSEQEGSRFGPKVAAVFRQLLR